MTPRRSSWTSCRPRCWAVRCVAGRHGARSPPRSCPGPSRCHSRQTHTPQKGPFLRCRQTYPHTRTHTHTHTITHPPLKGFGNFWRGSVWAGPAGGHSPVRDSPLPPHARGKRGITHPSVVHPRGVDVALQLHAFAKNMGAVEFYALCFSLASGRPLDLGPLDPSIEQALREASPPFTPQSCLSRFLSFLSW